MDVVEDEVNDVKHTRLPITRSLPIESKLETRAPVSLDPPAGDLPALEFPDVVFVTNEEVEDSWSIV